MGEVRVPTLAEAEAAIGEPALAWTGRCYEIAYRLVESGAASGRAVYGHYLGPVTEGSIFYARRQALPFVQHGWIQLEDGQICDPTRWAFEGRDPYVHLGPQGQEPDPLGDDLLLCLCGHLRAEHAYGGLFHSCDSPGCDCDDFAVDPWECPPYEYDEGGNVWRERTLSPPPPFDPQAEPVVLNLPAEAEQMVQLLLGGTPTVSVAQAHWLAKLPLKRLDGIAATLYRALEQAGLVGLIPYDNRVHVLGKPAQG